MLRSIASGSPLELTSFASTARLSLVRTGEPFFSGTENTKTNNENCRYERFDFTDILAVAEIVGIA